MFEPGIENHWKTLPADFRPYEAPPGFGVVTCFFNPNRYRSKLRNYSIFRESLRVSGIPCLTVECIFPDRTPQLTGWPNVDLVIARNAMWHKERLLNMAIVRVPDSWTTIAWLDCDVLFENSLWAAQAVEELSRQVVVQLFSDVVRLPKGEIWGRQGEEHWDSFASILKRAPNQLLKGNFARHGHTGFGWAAHRSLLTKAGLYDACIAGSGDHMMAHAFAGDWSGDCVTRELGVNTPHRLHFNDWAAAVYSTVRARVSCLPGTLFHLWHGDTANRRYAQRTLELASFQFDPTIDIRRSDGGCWEWASDKPDLHAWAAEYFAKRMEDGEEPERVPSSESAHALA